MLSLSAAVKLWFCPDPVDRRLGFDGLFALETLPGLFALGEKATEGQLLEWLPDRWLLRRAGEGPAQPAATG